MGKNRDRESLIKEITNLVVHEIVIKYTNRPESRNHVDAEIINYRWNVEKTANAHTWTDQDKEDIKEKALKKIIEKLASKYSDITYPEEEPLIRLTRLIVEMM